MTHIVGQGLHATAVDPDESPTIVTKRFPRFPTREEYVNRVDTDRTRIALERAIADLDAVQPPTASARVTVPAPEGYAPAHPDYVRYLEEEQRRRDATTAAYAGGPIAPTPAEFEGAIYELDDDGDVEMV